MTFRLRTTLRSVHDGARTRRPLGLACVGLVAAAWLTVAATAADADANDAPTLRFDPFRSPPATDDPTGARGRGGAAERAFEPILRSVVLAGDDSLANLGGEILGVGEAVHGYRLVRVREFEAEFVKDGRMLTLSVERGE